MEITIFKGLNNDIKKLREDVFVKEQGFHNEFDDIDNDCYYALMKDNEIPVTMCRFYPTGDGEYTIGRVCCDLTYRMHGYSKQVVLAAIDKIKELGGTKVALGAQHSAVGFYQTMGFVIQGESYYDEHCLHYHMELSL